jgi:hypothetical protein
VAKACMRANSTRECIFLGSMCHAPLSPSVPLVFQTAHKIRSHEQYAHSWKHVINEDFEGQHADSVTSTRTMKHDQLYGSALIPRHVPVHANGPVRILVTLALTRGSRHARLLHYPNTAKRF